MVRLQNRYVCLVAMALLFAVGAVRAEEAAPTAEPAVPAAPADAPAAPTAVPAAPAVPVPTATPAAPTAVPAAPAVPTATPAVVPVAPAVPAAPTDFSPGSSVPPGLGLSPEAPPAPPAPGGRAPSFGAPIQDRSSTVKIGGRLFGWESVGLGRTPNPAPQGYSGTALHVPQLSAGKNPFWGGAGATLNFQYVTPFVTAIAYYYINMNRKEYQGYANPGRGPGFGSAFLKITPPSMGKLRLSFNVGGFTEIFAGPGQWGWGIYGPLLALRGVGESAYLDYDLTPDLHLWLSEGFFVVPGVPEDFVRGEAYGWIETGVSSYVAHAHAGLTYKQYVVKLHYASDHGTDDRQHLMTALNTLPQDGRLDTYLAETRWQGDFWGQIGLSGGLYDFRHAASVGDGVWWGIDWTQGAREMMGKFLGPGSHGNGKVAVLSAEYDFSISRILWAPRNFNGQAPDLRVNIAGMLHYTVATDDPFYKNASGYLFGLETEYRMTSLFSVTFQSYAESRDGNTGRWSVYSLNPGIMYHSDWWSMDRIQLIYSRRFYSSAADPNSAQPLDHHMIALGATVTF